MESWKSELPKEDWGHIAEPLRRQILSAIESLVDEDLERIALGKQMAVVGNWISDNAVARCLGAILRDSDGKPKSTQQLVRWQAFPEFEMLMVPEADETAEDVQGFIDEMSDKSWPSEISAEQAVSVFELALMTWFAEQQGSKQANPVLLTIDVENIGSFHLVHKSRVPGLLQLH